MKNKQIDLKAQESEQADMFVDIDDEFLQSVAGGCVPNCGGVGGTTKGSSCVPPGEQCP